MAFPLPIPRLHLFEINDQPWFPQLLREKVQSCLTFFWTLRFPILQPSSPATLVANTLQFLLGPNLVSYTFVDYCAGAGGPTPSIERTINEQLRLNKANTQTSNNNDNDNSNSNHANGAISTANAVSEGTWLSSKKNRKKPPKTSPSLPSSVDFVLTDLFPHTPAWTSAAKQSPHLHFVPTSINAAHSPPDLLTRAGLPPPSSSSITTTNNNNHQIFRLYNLAFHHFPDDLASAILLNTLETSGGFAIFELQGRDVGNLLTMLALGPLLWAGSWWWFWGDWWHLFFTYVVPVVPTVVVFDGLVSCLRTRREGELRELVGKAVAVAGRGEGLLEGWRFEAGGRMHTYSGGRMEYFVGVREGVAV